MPEATPGAPLPGLARQASYVARRKAAGLTLVAVWVPVRLQAIIHETAEGLRAEAGIWLPSEVAGRQPDLFGDRTSAEMTPGDLS